MNTHLMKAQERLGRDGVIVLSQFAKALGLEVEQVSASGFPPGVRVFDITLARAHGETARLYNDQFGSLCFDTPDNAGRTLHGFETIRSKIVEIAPED